MNVLSLFSGCGGDTLGMKQAGFNVVAYSEFKAPAIESHQANFPDSVLIKDKAGKTTDITKIEDGQFEPYKGVKLVFAGFPCQGFSKAGKKSVTDPRNQMFRHFVRVVKITAPPFFIGENVTGLTSMKSGPNERRRHSISNLNYLILQVTQDFVVCWESLNLLKLIR